MRLEELYRQPAPGMAVPRRIRFSRDGGAVTYLGYTDGSNMLSLWRRELDGGAPTLLAGSGSDASAEVSFDEELLRQRNRERAEGVTAYQRSEQSDTILVVTRGRCLVSNGRSEARALDGIEGVQAASLSPDGSRIAFVRDGDVYLARSDGGGAERRTSDATLGVFNGLAEFVAAEELDRFEGMWWSGDSQSLLFASVDERGVPPFVIAHLGDPQPRVEEHRYPFAGGPNVNVTLRMARVGAGPGAGSRSVGIDLTDGYLARVVPHPGGGWLVARLPRDQRSLEWLRVGGDGDVSEIWVERCDPWINLDDATKVLSDGHVVRSTERTGFRHLELRRADGSLERQLTSGEWCVTALAHVDEARGEVLFLGTADGVVERQLHAVPLDVARPDARPRRLTQTRGWHEVAVSDDGNHWADTWSTCDTPPRVVIRARSGDPALELHASSGPHGPMGLVVPELRTLPAADGETTLHVALYLPPQPAGPATAPPPAVVWVYGGPHSQLVRDGWELTMNATRQGLALAGFAVVVVDNRGTANRGLVFEGAIAGKLGEVEVADQAAVIQALAAQGLIDRDRVGITGASYGGYLTVMAMLRRPDLFRAGVAGAPVVDWDGYDTAYTERYLGTPKADPEAYTRSSVLPRADALAGDLLLIHGGLDENVHLRHTGRLLAALHAAGRRANLTLLPGERHSARSPTSASLIGRLTIEHLCRAIDVPVPEDLLGDKRSDLGQAGAVSSDQAAW